MKTKSVFVFFLLALFSYEAFSQKRRKFKHPYGFGSAFGCFAEVRNPRKFRKTDLFRRVIRPYFEIGPRYGPSFLMGDFGGQWGRGMGSIKDVDLLASENALGIVLRLHPVNNLYFEVGYDRMGLYSNDRFSQEKYRKRRDYFARATLNEGHIGAYLHSGEFLGFSVHAGTGLLLYSLKGVAGANIPGTGRYYANSGIGWHMGVHFGKRLGKVGDFYLGATHRSVCHDKLDDHVTQQNDAYFTLYAGFVTHFPMPKRKVPTCTGFK